MNNYCSYCDQFTEHTIRPGNPAFAPKETEHGWSYDSRGEDMHTCTQCGVGSSHLDKAPPPERTFAFPCKYCNEYAQYTWLKDQQWADQEDWSWYSKECHCETKGGRYNLPDDPKKRDKYLDWQARGCPPPWWFRPTQIAVATTLITLCIWQPWWMLIAYLVLVYGLIGYEILSGQISFVGSRKQQIVMALIHWITAPLWFPLLFVLMAIRPPIL
jgi:hypothetical protein